MNRGWAKYVWKLLWFVGFIILLNFYFRLGHEIKDAASATFDMTPYLWFSAIMPFVIGLFIGLVFVKRWTWKFNFSLFLCVAIPSLVLHFSIPLIYIFPIENINLPLWSMSASTSNIMGVVAGIALMLSLFSDSEKNGNPYL